MQSVGDGRVGRRLVIGAVLIVVVLVSTLAITVLGAVREAGPRRELRRTVDLVAETARLRAIVGELGNAQAVVALDVVRDLPDAMGSSNPHRLAVERGLERARHQLGIVEGAVITAEERDRADQVREVLAAYESSDRQIADDHGSDDAGRRRQARAAVLDAQVDRYQELASVVVGLDATATERSVRLSNDIAAADALARLLHVAVIAVLITVVAALGVWLSRAERERRHLTDRLRHEAERDHLTGVANRRRWEHCLQEAMQHARRTGDPLSAVLIDLDHFKRYNDTYGHLAGDEHLRQVAATLVGLVGSRDRVARLGGEEFALLLPGHRPEEAALVVERVRPSFPHRQTFSAGVAGWEAAEAPLELMARADLALYRAKEHGRDRVTIAA